MARLALRSSSSNLRSSVVGCRELRAERISPPLPPNEEGGSCPPKLGRLREGVWTSAGMPGAAPTAAAEVRAELAVAEERAGSAALLCAWSMLRLADEMMFVSTLESLAWLGLGLVLLSARTSLRTNYARARLRLDFHLALFRVHGAV